MQVFAFVWQVHIEQSVFPQEKQSTPLISSFNLWVNVSAMHDGKYCRVIVHRLHTAFSDALCDTLSALYSECWCSLMIRTPLQYDGAPLQWELYKVRRVETLTAPLSLVNCHSLGVFNHVYVSPPNFSLHGLIFSPALIGFTWVSSACNLHTCAWWVSSTHTHTHTQRKPLAFVCVHRYVLCATPYATYYKISAS